MSDSPTRQRSLSPEDRRAITRWIAQAALGLVGYGAILFLSAGTLTWRWAWAFLLILAAFITAHPLLLIPINPALLAERQKGSQDAGVETWDRVLTMGLGLMMMLTWVVAGLDYRWNWPGQVSLPLQLVFLVLTALGYALFLWAMVSNAFFSEGVRIQSERGHAVSSGGPYHFVRHPGYVGVLLSHLSAPLLLGSYWALIPAGVLALVVIARTALEDRFLHAQLDGYAGYARHTRYRLLPGVW